MHLSQVQAVIELVVVFVDVLHMQQRLMSSVTKLNSIGECRALSRQLHHSFRSSGMGVCAHARPLPCHAMQHRGRTVCGGASQLYAAL